MSIDCNTGTWSNTEVTDLGIGMTFELLLKVSENSSQC